MNINFKTSFFKDVKKTTVDLHAEIDELIVKIEKASTLSEIANLKKLKGHKSAYRIKLNTYRLCFFYEDSIITIVRFLPRKDVYRFFP